MPNDFYYEWDHKVREVWRETIAAAGDSGTTTAEALAIAIERISRMVDDDELKVPLATAIKFTLRHVDKKDNDQADKMLARLLAGEEMLDLELEDGMDVVVALGKGRRKTIGGISGGDILTMDDIRHKNKVDTDAAYTWFKESVTAPSIPVLAKHRNMRSAVESGDLTRDR